MKQILLLRQFFSHAIMALWMIFPAVGLCQPSTDYLFDTKVVYQLEFLEDSLDEASKVTELAELLISGSTSLFRAVNFGIIDSISQENIRNGILSGASSEDIARYRSSYHAQTLKTGDRIYNYVNTTGTEKFLTAEEKPSMRWTMHEEGKTINGFSVQKATTDYGGRHWIAWFAADIPIFDGPYKFCDLPGLIVSCQDKTSTWSFNVISVHSDISQEVILDKYQYGERKKIGVQELRKELKYLLENSFELKLAAGDFRGVEPHVLERLKKIFHRRAEKENNWIELSPQ